MKTVSEKIARITDIQCELTRLRWQDPYPTELADKLHAEMKELGTPDVVAEVRGRMSTIKKFRERIQGE